MEVQTMDFTRFQRLLNSSKTYEFEDTVLIITDYRTGEAVRLDLSQLDEETYNEIVCEDEDD